MKQKLLFWLALLAAVLFATYFSVRVVMTLGGGGRVFDIRRVSVFTDSGKIDRAQILGALGVQPGTASFSTDLDGLLARVMTVPELESAAVRRLGNGNLSVRLKVRTAVATWTDGANFYPVAANGVIINRPESERPENSAVFRGNLPDDISEIVRSLNRAPKIQDGMDYAEWIENRRWNLVMLDGKIIKLPESGMDEALESASALNKKTEILSREITELDLRDKERTIVKVK
jgi:cell division protein FtsQ